MLAVVSKISRRRDRYRCAPTQRTGTYLSLQLAFPEGVARILAGNGGDRMDENVRKIKACGVLIMRENPALEFLLMRHADRLDLPKGHMEEGESEIETALRELEEETGIAADDLDLDPAFRFTTSYDVWPKRFGGKLCRKTTVIFLGVLQQNDVEIKTTEHLGFEWHGWNPPHKLQPETIDPLLTMLESRIRSDGFSRGP